ncbi:hypothetical protein [uncultured Agrococcus sp.]|uniref:hypothetical protein n=1 Tax=uncultured Agrococcus sp. TaxID=382258 RepID=UPI0025EA98BF|nr:hypothetical protein [uncultured Agrococcus sp.]
MTDRDESIENLIASIDAEFELGDAEHIWLRPDSTVAELQERLDGLGMRRVGLKAVRIASYTGSDLFFVVTVEGEQVFEDSDPNLAWTTDSARNHEREGASAMVSARYDDRGLYAGFVDFVLDSNELNSRGLLSSDDGQGVLGILVPELEAVVPLTYASVISWRSRFDGTDNELIVRDGPAYRELMARFGDYYSSRPLDPARVEADIERIHAFMTRLAAGERIEPGEWHGG